MSEHTAENDALTEAERNALDDSLMDSGCHGLQGDHPDLYATAERIVRERMARAWDEGRETGIRNAQGYAGSNPYRPIPPGETD